jgi:hypothetical protein
LQTPPSWAAASAKLADAKEPEARRVRRELALIFGDAQVRAELLQQAANSQADGEDRIHAIELLVTDRAEALPPLLIKLLNDETVRPAAIRGLAAFDLAETPGALISRYGRLTASEKEDVVQTLSARPD